MPLASHVARASSRDRSLISIDTQVALHLLFSALEIILFLSTSHLIQLSDPSVVLSLLLTETLRQNDICVVTYVSQLSNLCYFNQILIKVATSLYVIILKTLF